MKSDSIVIIPTYNEKENIEKIIRAVFGLEKQFDILVIDDGSPDGTAAIVKNLMAGEFNGRLHILERSGKLGLGTAYITGFKWALQQGYDFIFEMDADFSHRPSDLVRFLEKAENADLVLGSRYNGRHISVVNWDWKRLLLSYSANLYTRIVTGLPIGDATGGFKCFSRSALEAVDLSNMKSDGYCFQIETTFKVWKKGLKVVEIPIVFTDRIRGTSKMSGGIISEAFFLVLKLRFGRA